MSAKIGVEMQTGIANIRLIHGITSYIGIRFWL